MCTASSHSKKKFSTIAGCSSSLSIHLGIISSFHSLPPIPLLKKKDKDSTKGKGRRCCLGEELIQFLAALFWDLNTVLVWARLRFSRIVHCKCTLYSTSFPLSRICSLLLVQDVGAYLQECALRAPFWNCCTFPGLAHHKAAEPTGWGVGRGRNGKWGEGEGGWLNHCSCLPA